MNVTTRKKPRPKKAKLTDAVRHARFIETARKVEASEDPAEFERAFGKVTRKDPRGR